MTHTKHHKKINRSSRKNRLTKSHKVKHNKKHNRKTKKHMKGGMMNLAEPIFVPKGVPFLPPSGSANTGNVNGGYYYNLAKPSLHAPNDFLMQSYPVQNGGNLIPKPLVDIGRQIVYHVQNTTNTLMGGQTLPVSANPSELAQPIANEHPHYDVTPVDMVKIRSDAVQKAANVV